MLYQSPENSQSPSSDSKDSKDSKKSKKSKNKTNPPQGHAGELHGSIRVLTEAIDKKDAVTGSHLRRVVYYSTGICKKMGMTPEQMEEIRIGALLHDVGKIGISDQILKKPSALNIKEREVMETHSELGYDILSRTIASSVVRENIMDGVLHHHERWDGEGYPSRLKGAEIPLMARVIAVADAFDAMISARPYTTTRAPHVAMAEIILHRGTQFDPEIVDAFVEAFGAAFKESPKESEISALNIE